MLIIWTYTLLSVLAVSLISLVGIIFLSFSLERLKYIIFFLVSLAAGALIGDTFIHLLPEILEEHDFSLAVSLSIIAGITIMFVVEKVVHWHHCHIPSGEEGHTHPLAITNLIGDLVHNFLDGLIIATSYIVSLPVGIATTLAVFAHEIPQEISDFGVLLHSGFSRKKALFANFIVALGSMLGAVFALLFISYVEAFSVYFLAVSAGIFIYVAGSDLIPELHKELHIRKSIAQVFGFILGVIAMLFLLLIE
ncbi:MAG: ZIP family metal transporter [Candidatus Magasanikbacteria bacterium]|nr:ZIP family metal transporter [Candidatus Magasanikbacteria bacterium]